MNSTDEKGKTWALDISRLESAEVIEGLQNASLDEPNDDEEDRGDELDPSDRPARPGRVEMDATDSPASGGMGISDEEINRGVGEVFDGLTKIASGMAGQDLTPTPDEKDEAGKKLGPLVQKRFPTVRRYTLETAALLWILGYFNDKADLTEFL